MQQPEYQLSSAFRLQSAPLLNEDSTAQPEDFSDCDSVVVQVEEQSISPQPVVLQSSRPNSAYSNEPEVQQDTHEQYCRMLKKTVPIYPHSMRKKKIAL